MVLHKIDGKMNMQNCGYSAMLRDEIATDALRLMATAVATDSCCRFSKRWHCRHQKHRRRWPDNPNGLSKFRKYCAYLPILCLIDRDWCCATSSGFWRSLKWHVADVKNITGDDQEWLKFYDYQNLCLRNQARPLKNIFLQLERCHYDVIAQRLLFLPTKNNFLTTLIPTEKPRYRYWRAFFCRFYLWQNHRYHFKKIFFSIFKQKTYA